MECGPWKNVNSPCTLSSLKPQNRPFQGCHWGCRRPFPHSANRCSPLRPNCCLERLFLQLDKQSLAPALLCCRQWPIRVSLSALMKWGRWHLPGVPSTNCSHHGPGISLLDRVGAQTSVHLSRACSAGPSAAARSSARWLCCPACAAAARCSLSAPVCRLRRRKPAQSWPPRRESQVRGAERTVNPEAPSSAERMP